MDKWDARFYDLAKHISTWSKDPSTKVGAVIVNDLKQVVGIGYNGFPRGILDSESRYSERGTKHLFVVHAERNALDNAFTDVRGCSMYITHFPCNECMKSILQRGIKRVIVPKPDPTKEYVKDLAKITATYTMFCEGKVELIHVE
jgi:dCMP deaminase